ncbi:fibronectin type III domain-containing protein [Ditylenchus destructor]|uniref:Fibronectin type III domain-containing protein n=1 Tax=Ditylenchus destructor TaxID=166010 RepID=A0AAD4NFT1_9BILA|nr:fibronectin type III domain-containing protein [Ditylenchus destructor]
MSSGIFQAIAFYTLLLCIISDLSAKLITGRPPTFNKVEQTKFYPIEGFRFSLKCPVVDESADVRWYLDGKPLERHTLSLVIPTISRIDSGIYRCFAQNGIGGVFSPAFNVTVAYLDGFANESNSLYQIKVPSASFITIPPPALLSQGIGDFTWKWFYDSQEITSDENFFVARNGYLIILDAGSHIGQYHVEAATSNKKAYSNNYLLSEDNSLIPLRRTFDIVYRPQDAQVIFDGRVYTQASFDCVPYSPKKSDSIEIRWYLNNTEITSSDRIKVEHSKRRLTIPDVSEMIDAGAHSAEIRCEARTADNMFQARAIARLDILEPPRINRDSLRDEVAREIGQKVKLTCKEGEAWPRSKMFWYFNGNKLSNVSTESFRIGSIQQKDFGVYQCEAENQVGTDIAHIWLRAGNKNELPQQEQTIAILEAPSNVVIKAGEDITLVCRTKEPSKTLTSWKHNGIEIEDDDDSRFSINITTLTLHAAKTSDSGKYTCLAKSLEDTGAPLVTASATVTVLGTQLIEQGPANQSLLIGSYVEMPCKISESHVGRGDVSVEWYRNNQEIGPNGDLHRRISINSDGSLFINQVGPDNIGVYKCTVHTSDGESESATAWLRIIEKPSMPQKVQVELINDTSPAKIRVTWEPGFDGNSPIVKYSVDIRTISASGLWSDWSTVVENIPESRCCSTFIENVKPTATAEFRVIGHNSYGSGKPSQPSQNITMPQQPPAAAPRSVGASSRSSSSIMVQWQPPPAEQWNGDILGYIVRYRLSGYATAEWTEKNLTQTQARNYMIEPLITWREYDIQVAAYNERGTGVFSKIVEVTTLEGVPLQAPQNVKVDVLNSTDIEVSFDPPDPQLVPGVNLGYKIELWKDFKTGQPFRTVRVFPEPSRIVEHISRLEKFGHYNVTVLCFTSPGDGPRSDPIEVITAEDVPGPVASIMFDQITSDSVIIQWEKPSEPNGLILKYVIQYWESKKEYGKKEIQVSAEENSITIEDLAPTTRYSVSIQAVTKMGTGEIVDANFESGVTPELPGRATALMVSNVQARSTVIQFVPGFDGHSFIRRWIVEARVGSSSIYSTIFNISLPKARSFTVEGLRPYTDYQLRLISENVRGRGAPSDPSKPFKTLQTIPEKHPENVYAEPTSSTQVLVGWTPLISSLWNGEPIGYVAFYRASKPMSTNQSRFLIEGGIFEHQNGEANEVLSNEWKQLEVPNSKASELAISGLSAFTPYQIKLCAKNSFGLSASSPVVIVTTYEGIPPAPQNVVAEPDEKEPTIRVSWDELNPRNAKGEIVGYTVRVVPDEEQLRPYFSKTIEVNSAHSTEISGLRPFTRYKVSVSASTIAGEGPTSANSLLIMTPELLPGMPSNVSFALISASEVRLTWDAPRNPNGKILGYAIRHWPAAKEQDASDTPIPENFRVFSATHLTPDTTYFFAIKAENSVGWGPERRLAVLTNSRIAPLPTPPIPSQNSLKQPSSDSIHISWPTRRSTRSGDSNRGDDQAPVRWVEVEFQKANENSWTRLPFNIDDGNSEATVEHLSPNTAYRTRIQFFGDMGRSSGWSEESDWIKTLEAPPVQVPRILQAKPYESSSMIVKWAAIDHSKWNSDQIFYRILYRIYPSNGESFTEEEIMVTDPQKTEFEYIIRKLSSFHHYVVKVTAKNLAGISPVSKPWFVYVGYSIPKQAIKSLEAESLSSSSIRISWDNWTANDDDLISGYKVRYAPLLSTLSPEIRAEAENSAGSTEESVIADKNEIILHDLRKFTEYQISVAGYNRAGEGQASVIRQRTLEDTPGPVGPLIFQDILLNSVNVSWAPPQQPNGIIQGYVINYKTYKLAKEYRNEVQEKIRLNYHIANNLEENVTYFFNVRAETSAGFGLISMTGNITTGYNFGAPQSPSKPSVIPEQSTFLLMWQDKDPGVSPIRGHLIQAKRVGSSLVSDFR